MAAKKAAKKKPARSRRRTPAPPAELPRDILAPGTASGAPPFQIDGVLSGNAPSDDAPTQSLSAIIGEVTGAPAAPATEPTTLDELIARENAAAGAPDEPEPESAPRRGRGRPPGSRTRSRTDAAPVAVVSRDGITTTPRARETKEELAARNAQLESENARLVAQNDEEKVGRLAESIKFLTITCFAPLAMWRGPHWEMGEQEAGEIAEPTAHALAPYADDIERKLPWAAPVLAIGTAVARRVMLDVKIQQDAEARAAAASARVSS